MIIKNVTEKDLYEALRKVNKHFDNNVIFEHCNSVNTKGNRWSVRLRVKSSRGKGARLGFSGRHLINACWHVHGEFLEALPKDAVIYTAGKTVYPGDWEDWNIGSQMNPMYFSEACECN